MIFDLWSLVFGLWLVVESSKGLRSKVKDQKSKVKDQKLMPYRLTHFSGDILPFAAVRPDIIIFINPEPIDKLSGRFTRSEFKIYFEAPRARSNARKLLFSPEFASKHKFFVTARAVEKIQTEV